MYNELAMIGLVWSREMIYEEWNSLRYFPKISDIINISILLGFYR